MEALPHRRHLTESQRAMVAGKRAGLKHGEIGRHRERKSEGSIGLSECTIDEAAELLSVSPKSVKRAREVLEHGSKELVRAVETGEKGVGITDTLGDGNPRFQKGIHTMKTPSGPQKSNREKNDLLYATLPHSDGPA